MEFSVKNYFSVKNKIYDRLDEDKINNCIDLICDSIENNKKILTCGNGGSAHNASHAITDWQKMYLLATGKSMKSFCLNDNQGLLTAYSNDLTFNDVFSLQIKSILEPGDLLIVFSGSGKSGNIIKALETTKAMKGKTLGILGYDGGKAIDLCDEVFHVPSFDMQICEDIHLSFIHMVMKYLCNSEIIDEKKII